MPDRAPVANSEKLVRRGDDPSIDHLSRKIIYISKQQELSESYTQDVKQRGKMGGDENRTTQKCAPGK
jgi:hypothetical protein